MATGAYRYKFFDVQELRQKVDDYFDIHIPSTDNIPDVEDFAVYLGCTRETLHKYENCNSSLDEAKALQIADTLKSAKARIFAIQKQFAFRNQINASVFMFSAKNNHNYADKLESTVKIDADVTSRLHQMSDAELETLRSSLHTKLLDSVSS